ncbi:MAG: iron donor protein CyaY [Alphaproteobacteria bacterium]|nr:iron donor protein CyaY [Alphaproteobacteria bacterium]
MDDFDSAANRKLEELSHFFEDFWPEADVDLFESNLMVNLPGKRQYLINKHGVTRQIWVSSPFTGAHHFKHKDGSWISTRTNKSIEAFLQHEKNAHAS